MNPGKVKEFIYDQLRKLDNVVIQDNIISINDPQIIINLMYKHIVIQQTPKNLKMNKNKTKYKYKLIIEDNINSEIHDELNMDIQNLNKNETYYFNSIDEIVDFINDKFKPIKPITKYLINKLYKNELNLQSFRTQNITILKKIKIINIQ
jgi:hypothetical protein